MSIAILDPFSGISGDMTLGALVDLGLDPDWLRALPGRLGIDGVGVRIAGVRRAGIACKKVDFEIPPQPHGRHIHQIRELVRRADVPPEVAQRADAAFTAVATAEGEIHGVPPDRVHLHEVGAVDAILDIVGSVWGLVELGVSRVYCGALSLGDGFVTAAHGRLPVPAPATLKLLEGHPVRPGPDGAGELVTPTGAALVRVLSSGPPPREYVPRASGYGAGTKEFSGSANALRIVLADAAPADGAVLESLVLLATDIDDMSGEHLAAAADTVREAGALDVTCVPTLMKKARPGTRLEALARREDADTVELAIIASTTTLGVRRSGVERRALARHIREVHVLGRPVRVKVASLPGGRQRVKPEFEDVRGVARATGRSVQEIATLAAAEAERQ